jgi:SnoaL-like domain
MTTHEPERREVESAFQHFWTVGNVDENWAEWPSLFTEDVHYVEHVYGEMRGREAVRKWIGELMANHRDVHAVIDWYMIRGRRVVVNMQNRYYNPDPAGAAFDFPGITILEYAGDGLFRYEEDYWCVRTAKACHKQFEEAVARCGGRGLEGGRFEALEARRRADALALFARGG